MIIHTCEQRSEEWYALRIGLPTASEFSKLITSKGAPSKSADTYAITLAGEKYAGKGELDAWQGNDYTERGKELEDQAIQFYEFDRDVKVERVGFVTDDDVERGCSPDGLVGDDGMIEIKCLKAENHIKAILYYKKNGRSPTDYIQQAQGQMMICERDWCDIVFYHPVLPLLVIRQTPDPALQEALKQQLAFVCSERDKVLKVLGQSKEKQTVTLAIVGDTPPAQLPPDLSDGETIF